MKEDTKSEEYYDWVESCFPYMDIVQIYGEWIEQKESEKEIAIAGP